MKLPIKDKYFKQIKNGKKTFELRDAHITFVNEKTGETIKKKVITAGIINIDDKNLDKLSCITQKERYEIFEDNELIYFMIE